LYEALDSGCVRPLKTLLEIAQVLQVAGGKREGDRDIANALFRL